MPRTGSGLVFTREKGARLRQLRTRAGLKQSELAKRMGLSGKDGDTTVCRRS